MRLRIIIYITFTFLIATLFMDFALASELINKQPTKALWYEPKVERSQTEGSSIVHLYGRTRRNLPLFADIENATVIRRANPDLKLKPRAILTSVKSDQTGNFELVFELPHGLTQLSIYFNKYVDTEGEPLLLTIQVSEESVQLNVKISERPIKKKVRKVEYKTKYVVGLGLGYFSINETSAASGFSDRTFSSSSFISPKIYLARMSRDWWFKIGYESMVGQTLNKIQFEARYRLTRNFGLIAGLDRQTMPILAADASNSTQFTNISTLRYSIGPAYYTQSTKWITFTGLTYNAPFYISVDSGEISYTSKFNFNLYSEIKYRFDKNWLFGIFAAYEYGSIGYDLANSQRNINYTGATATTGILQALLTADYIF